MATVFSKLVGQLGRSLDAMAGKLSTALTELESANQSLRGEVERERELDRLSKKSCIPNHGDFLRQFLNQMLPSLLQKSGI